MIPTFFLKNWRVGLLVLGVLAAWGTVVHMRNTMDRLETRAELAEADATNARDAAAQERANATELAERLDRAREDARRELEARTAAEEARDAALAASEERSGDLRETVIVERERDPTLDSCLGYELPDSIVRQLPFGPR